MSLGETPEKKIHVSEKLTNFVGEIDNGTAYVLNFEGK